MPRKRTPQETLLPPGKSNTRRRDELYEPLRSASESSELLAEIGRLRDDLAAHPDTMAMRQLEAALQVAHLHPAVDAAPEVSRLVFVLRELIADAVPGLTVEQWMEPLQTVLSRRGGGRPTKEQTHARWARRFDELRKTPTRRDESPRVVYEDIAAEESERTKSPVPWRRVQAGILAARKKG